MAMAGLDGGRLSIAACSLGTLIYQLLAPSAHSPQALLYGPPSDPLLLLLLLPVV